MGRFPCSFRRHGPPLGGTVSGSCGTFGKWSLAGRSVSLRCLGVWPHPSSCSLSAFVFVAEDMSS